jgi:predicted TIM-barrel fold metal-dependent hydrolase
MPQYENSVGLITGLGFHSQTDNYLKSFIVRFEELIHIFGDGRIVWANDIQKHYPVVK